MPLITIIKKWYLSQRMFHVHDLLTVNYIGRTMSGADVRQVCMSIAMGKAEKPCDTVFGTGESFLVRSRNVGERQ